MGTEEAIVEVEAAIVNMMMPLLKVRKVVVSQILVIEVATVAVIVEVEAATVNIMMPLLKVRKAVLLQILVIEAGIVEVIVEVEAASVNMMMPLLKVRKAVLLQILVIEAAIVEDAVVVDINVVKKVVKHLPTLSGETRTMVMELTLRKEVLNMIDHQESIIRLKKDMKVVINLLTILETISININLGKMR